MVSQSYIAIPKTLLNLAMLTPFQGSNITSELAKCVMPVLEDLRKYQMRLDPKGILGSES